MSNHDNTEGQPYLGRCKHPGCGYALFATPSQITYCEDARGCTPGGAPKRVGNYGVCARCPSNHKVFPLFQIKGTYSKDHKCDARCLNAKGHNCTCSCGGLNHGRGFAIEHVTTSTAPAVTAQVAHIAETVEHTGDYPVIQHTISPAQVRLVLALLDERELPAKGDLSPEARREAGIAAAPNLTQRQARATIDFLKSLPYRSAVAI